MAEKSADQEVCASKDWRAVVEAWAQLSPDEQLRRRLERIPEKVAMSMAFEGEPVDVEMLKQHLAALIREQDPNLNDEEQEK